jgi:PqqA peptide cyclase
MTLPTGLLAELTHRCPLRCPYCSNPLEMVRAKDELTLSDWDRVFREAAALGVLQVHLSGGEPLARRDLEGIVAHARAAGLYTNLITSGVGLSEARLDALRGAGLEHVQLSVQDAVPVNADRIASYDGGFAAKREAARRLVATGLPLTLNAPLHRQNVRSLPALIAMARDWGAERIEIAHTQYYGWALANRAALLPTREELDWTVGVVAAARAEHGAALVIDFVLPDYYAERPKPCMGGWGREVIVVTPSGAVWPCHAAGSLPDMIFANVRELSLAGIWHAHPSFAAYRGTDWMQAPCRTCDRREVDFGGCRCQAYALAGDAAATDPVCGLSPQRARVTDLAAAEAGAAPPAFRYRRFGG